MADSLEFVARIKFHMYKRVAGILKSKLYLERLPRSSFVALLFASQRAASLKEASGALNALHATVMLLHRFFLWRTNLEHAGSVFGPVLLCRGRVLAPASVGVGGLPDGITE